MIRALAVTLCFVSAATAQDASRVITLGGSVTEIAVALGAEDRLIARDTTSTWPVCPKRSSTGSGSGREPPPSKIWVSAMSPMVSGSGNAWRSMRPESGVYLFLGRFFDGGIEGSGSWGV